MENSYDTYIYQPACRRVVSYLRLHLFCTNLSLQAVRYVESRMTSKFWAPISQGKKGHLTMNSHSSHSFIVEKGFLHGLVTFSLWQLLFRA